MEEHQAFSSLLAAWAVLQARHDDDDNDNAIDDMMFAWPVGVAQVCSSGKGANVDSNVALTPFRPNIIGTDSVQRVLNIKRPTPVDMLQQEATNTTLQQNENGNDAPSNHTLLVSPDVPAGHHPGLEAYGLFVRLEQDDESREVRVKVAFKPGMGSETQAQSIARQVQHVLRQLATVDPSTSIESLDMVPLGDLSYIWNLNRDVDPAIRSTVTDLLTRNFEQRPDAPAICAWDGELTYGELGTLSSHLAQYLIQQGVKPGVIVPICFERSLWAPVAMLAVIKAGGAGLTIDVTQPEERLRANVTQILPTPVILSSMSCGEFALRLAPEAANFRVMRETIESLPRERSILDVSQLSPQDPICIVFTSGSTGKPKGITLTHTNFSSALVHQSKRILIHQNSRVYYFASFAFDAAWHNLLHTLYNGACLCVPSESERKNDVSGSICRYGATWADLTPRLGELLEDRALKCLELLQLAGERPNPTIINRIRKLVSVRFAYGPAECAVMSTISTNDAHFTSVGSGAGLRTWIVYPDGSRLMPVGSVGELWLEGPLVGKGYMHDPVKTAAAFVQDPPWLLRGCPEVPGRHGRLYRTGDLVRYDGGDQPGGLTFIGRKDGQVKIRGQRVELAEVDHHVWQQLRNAKSVVNVDGNGFLSLDNVRVAAEVVKFANSIRPLLVAFICPDTAPSSLNKVEVAAPGDPIAVTVRRLTQDLDEHLSAVMPSYMVPSAFIPVTTIPVTPTCKSDRRRLREMAASMTLDQVAALSDRKLDRVEPSTPQEKKLQKLWSKVLDVDADKISAEDNFYRIGGDSIVAMKLIGLARKEGVKLTVAKILRHPRLMDLAKTLPATAASSSRDEIVQPFSLLSGTANGQRISAEAAIACGVPESAVQDVLPCSPLQEGLLALTSTRGDYVTRHVFRLLPGTDLDRFREAWAKVISSIPILRTRIVDLPRFGLVQVVLDGPPEWQVVQGSSFQKTAPQRIHMGLGTRLSFFMIYDEGEHVYLTWTAHHALFDAWSIGMIFDAVSRVYQKASAPKTDSFATFVKAIRACKEEDAMKYWSSQFAGSTAVSFPAVPSENYRPRADTVLSINMENFSWADDKHTIATAAKASWALVQANLTEGEDVLFGSTLTGRQFPVDGIERIVGPTIATVPLRIIVDQTRTVNEFLSAVQGQGIDMIAYEQTGMQRIRRIAASIGSSCDFQTILVVQPKQMALHTERGLLHDQIEGDILKDDKALNSVNSYALMVQFELDSTSARIRLSFDSVLLSRDRAHQIARQLKQAFRQICTKSNHAKPIQDLELVPPDDVDTFWRKNALVPPTAKATVGCVHDLIAKKSQQQPEAPAVCAWDGGFTYQELNMLSTRLAHHLVRKGLQAETIVPLCFEKSMWTPVAQLAVMKAGGACLALDMSQPEQRLRALIEQAQPTLILASSAFDTLAKRLSSAPTFIVEKTTLNDLSESSSTQLPSVSQTQLAYVVFTSGSTGVPKGAMVTHKNAVSATVLQTDQLKIRPTSRVLDFTSYAFDVTWSNFIHSLVVGGCICIPSDHDRLNSLTACVRSLRANYVHIIPSVSHLLEFSDLENLEILHFSGEPLPPSVVNSVPPRIQVINSYGPAECTVTSTIKHIGTTRHQEINIGNPLGSLGWVVRSDAKDLVPLGATGELWLEGPLVGRGYLNDSAKTSSTFIEDPAWLLRGSRTYPGRRGRLYRTGDLVRQGSDGSLVYISRKDGQVKVNGQRVELGEVEHNVLEILTKKYHGLENVRLIAEAVKLSNSERTTIVVFVCPWAADSTQDEAATRAAVQKLIEGLNARLAEHVPAYMIPSAFIPLASIPMTATGKTDHRKLRQIAGALDSNDLLRSDGGKQDAITAPSSAVEHALCELWATILGVSTESISITESFTRLGGDSITAMQLVSRARNHSLKILLRTADILRLQTIQKIARASRLDSGYNEGINELEDDVSGGDWALAPIQNHFFRVNPHGDNHWSQSFALRLKDASYALQLQAAIEIVERRHKILRARFRRSENATWKQSISEDRKLVFERHQVASFSDVQTRIKRRHKTFDIECGPVFAADAFSIIDGKVVVLVLSAHHLVVDLVSWRIIWDDIERSLRGEDSLPPAISFRQWCKLQERETKTGKGDYLLPFQLREADLEYWGIVPTDNVCANFETQTISLDKTTSRRLLGASNKAFRTEPLDIIAAVLLKSFQNVFTDRSAPPLWVEGHGRETPVGYDVDLSETVGWFTTIYPLQLSEATISSADPNDFLRETKDVRRKVQPYGRQYFADRQMHQHHNAPDNEGIIEILLNYVGRSDQIHSDSSLFAPLDSNAAIDIEQLAPESRRLALVELVVGIQNDQLQIRVVYNKLLKQQRRLKQWIEQYAVGLDRLSNQLSDAEPMSTWADFPLLSRTSYRDLDRLMTEIRGAGVSVENVRDIYPCTPMQEGIILSRSRGTASYANHWIWSCQVHNEGKNDLSNPVSVDRLQRAWQSVIEHHSIFATVFVEDPTTGRVVQLILDSHKYRIIHVAAEELPPTEHLRRMSAPIFPPGAPEYQVTICQRSSHDGTREIACRLDLSHAMSDAASTSIILQDLQKAYDDQALPLAPPFSEVVRAIKGTTDAERQLYWAKFLHGSQPCHIPGDLAQLRATSAPLEAHDVFFIPAPRAEEISQFCRLKNVTQSTFLQLVWALVLYSCTGIDQPCFGFLSSGRDLPIDGVEEIVGPLINMLTSCISLQEDLDDILTSTSRHLVDHLDNQHMSLAKVQHELGLRGKQLFNTSITIRNASFRAQCSPTGLNLTSYHSEDMHEFDVTLAAEVTSSTMNLLLTCRRSNISRALSREIRDVFDAAMNFLLDYGSSKETSSRPSSPRQSRYNFGEQFSDYRLGGVSEEEARAYWTAMLGGTSGVTFPEHQVPASSDCHVENMHTRFNCPALASRGHSLEAIVRLAWAILQSQYTDEDDVVYGNASIDGPKSLAISPVRMKIDRTKPVQSVLDRTEDQIITGRPFESTGLHWLRRVSDDLKLACKFQTLLTTASDMSQEIRDDLSNTYSLIIEVKEGQPQERDHLQVQMHYRTSALSTAQVRDISSQFHHVVNQLCQVSILKPGRLVGELDLVSSEDLDSIWCRNSTVLPTVKRCVHDSFAEVVQKTPEAPAICAWDGGLLYKELDVLSSRLAHYLVNLGVRPGVIVPLCFEKSVWTPVAKLAVIKSGGACLALDVNQPEERLSSISHQVSPVVILTSNSYASLAGRLCSRNKATRVVVADKAMIDDLRIEISKPLPTVSPTDLLYVVFTSGSTGTPKAAMITHQNFSSAIQNQQKALGFFQGARVFDFVSYAFDVSWSNFLHSITIGACLCIPSEDDRIHNTIRAMDKLQVTYANVTPSMERRLQLWNAKSLKVLSLSGEALENFDRSHYPDSLVIKNTYGPSECTVKATVETITTSNRKNSSIGCAVGCNAWVVRSDTNKLVPPGSIGELWLEGPQVGQGYFSDSEKTASVFVEDPPWLLAGSGSPKFAGRRGRLYRTGDLVRQQPDGSLIFLGRKDGQVKLRGQRLELGEVEFHVRQQLAKEPTANIALRTASLTAEVVTLANSHQQSLVIFVHLAAMSAADAEAHSKEVTHLTRGLNENLSRSVPAYMVPRAYIPISRLPMTATGKLDRRHLRKIATEIDLRDVISHESAGTIVEPTNQQERAIRDIWASALDMPPASISTIESFMRLGGDSITAMQIVGRCREQRIPIRTADILRLQSIREIVQNLKKSTIAKPIVELPYYGQDGLATLVDKIMPLSDVSDIYPCTPLQEGVLLSKMGGSASYANHWTWTCRMLLHGAENSSAVSIDILERAWQSVVARHSVFATTFVDNPETGEILQVLRKEPSLQIVRLCAGNVSAGQALQERCVPIYAVGQPEYLVSICSDSFGGVACRLDMNHALSDASSIPILIRDLKKTFNAYQSGLSSPLLPAPPFRDVIQAIAQNPVAERQAYWQDFLKDVRPCRIPTDFAKSMETKARAHHIILISSVRTNEILNFCRLRNITQSTFLHVVWALVLNACTGSNEPCFGFLSSGRDLDLDQVDEIVGPLINILASRISLQGKQSLDSILTSTSQDLIEHLNHQHMSLAKIHHHLGLHSGQLLFNTSVTIRNASFRLGETKDGLDLQEHHNEDPHEFDMTLAAEVEGTSLELALTCRRDTIKTATAFEMKSLFETAIEFVLDSGSHSREHVYCDAGTLFFESRRGCKPETIFSYWSRVFDGATASPFPAHQGIQGPFQVNATFSEQVGSANTGKLPHDLSILFQASWALTQAEHSEEDDTVYGITVAGSHAAVMPMRTIVNRKEAVHDLLDRLKQQRLRGRQFEQTGLHIIRRISSDTAHACQFRTLLVDPEADSTREHDFGLNDYGLIVRLSVSDDDGMTVDLSYDSNLVNEEEVRSMGRLVAHTMNQLCMPANQGIPVGAISLLPFDEAATIWRRNAVVPSAIDACMHDIIHERAGQQPQSPAVCAWDGELTYKELDDLSTRVAQHLIALGVKAGTVVPLCFEKCVFTPLAMLAVMKAGGASVVLDVTQPTERLRSIVAQIASGKQASLDIILSSKSCASLAQEISAVPVAIIDRFHLDGLRSSPATLPSVSPSDTLYVVFTSGSTGLPKGAMISHANAASAVALQKQTLRFNASSRVLDSVSYAFDVTWSNFLYTLSVGGCLCVPREEDRINNLNKCITEFQVNYLHITPSVAQLLDFSFLGSLETLSFIGEPLSSRLVDQVPSHVHVLNTYGPAECTVTATISDIGTERHKEVDIGKPIGGIAWIVRGDQLALLGSVGELWLEGPHVGLGYLDDVDKTAAAFIQDPRWLQAGLPSFLSGRCGRLYKTGDLVRQRHNGSLVYVGRSDGQVKIRGQRLELGEVEYHVRKQLQGVPGADKLQMAAEVVALKGSQREALAVFLCIPRDDSAAMAQLTQGLNERLSRIVPAFMVPSAYIPVGKQLPMTSTGKTDRRALKELASSITSADLASLQSMQVFSGRKPSTQAEKLLQLLWATVLGIDPENIGADDSFFHLGGDSIMAMRLVGAARKQSLTLTVSDILQQPRLSDLAHILGNSTTSLRTKAPDVPPFSLLNHSSMDNEYARAHVAAACGVSKKSVQDILPCTPLQQGLLAMTANRGGDYVGKHVLKLQRSVNLERFEKAWQVVVDNTPILRTRIVDLPGQGLVQVVIDCRTGFQVKQSDTSIEEIPDIGLGTPLSYFILTHSSEEDCIQFTWIIHHALYDAWSMSLIFGAVAQAYDSNGAATIHHEPFSAFVNATVTKANKENARIYWKKQFENLEAVHFPDRGSQKAIPCADTVIIEPIKENLEWRDDRFTLATAIRAAWAICQSTYTDNNDVVFGTTVTGRQAAVPGIDQIVGPTIAAVPVRLTIDRSSTVRTLLQQVHDGAVQMIPFEQTGLSQIKQISSDAEHACQFQTLLVVQPETSPGKEKDLFTSQSSNERVRAFTSYPLMIQVELRGSSTQLRVSFDSGIISEVKARGICWQLSHTLRQLCSQSPQTTIDELENVSAEDLDISWKRNADLPGSIDSPVHELLAATIQRQPTAPAICAWDGNLTYSELDNMSTRLAHHLLGLGLGASNAVVPLCFEKSMWTPVAMLAVIKAGSASVVLDVTQPEERLRTIMGLVSTPFVLCSASCTGLAARLVSKPTPIIGIDYELVSNLPKESSALLPTVLATQLLCVIFTSGSTGVPKGIEIEHRNFSSALVHQQKKLGLTRQSRFFCFASHSFDATWHNLLHTLWNGGCLCIPSEHERRNSLSASIVKYKANFADFTPTVAQTLTSDALSCLKSMILVGEAGEMRIVNRIRQSTEVRFVYGPAECSVMTTISDSDAICSNIGHQFGLCTWVVSQDGTQLLPCGAVGELWIEGPLVGRGYLKDMEKTRMSFIETPAWLLCGSATVRGRRGKLYRTGDLVRREDDGSLTFIGRKDGQVKLRGQRVELGEVEHHVLQNLRFDKPEGENHPVAVAAEVVTLSNSRRPTLVVFMCPTGSAVASGTNLDMTTWNKAEVQRLTTGISERLSETLPVYMVPSAWIPLANLPLTATGKTDRRRLKEMASKMALEDLIDFSSAAGTQERTAPSTTMEILLQGLWSAVLGIEKDHICAEDTFFRVGGDSISAMRLVEAARLKGFSFTVSDIMQQPRLKDLAPFLKSNAPASIEAPKPFSLLTESEQQAITTTRSESWEGSVFTLEDAYPASFVQRYYIEDSSETRFGVHFLVVDLPHIVDDIRLEQACQRTVEQFDILRTIFKTPCERTLQVVLKNLRVPFDKRENVQNLDQSTHQICQEHTMDTLYDRSVLHFFMLRDCDRQARLIVRISHAQYDGVTLPAVLSALGKFYAGAEAEKPPPFSALIRTFISTNARSLPYWSSLLQGSAMSFPAMPPSSSLTITNPVITATRTISVRELIKSKDITPAHYFTAACAVMLAKITGSEDVLFGRLVSGRAGLPGGLANGSGPCINTVPVRAIFDKNIEPGEVLSQVVQQYVEGMPHEQVGFDDLKDKCASWPASVQNFGVVTKYQNIDETPPLEIEGIRTRSKFYESEMKQTKFNMVRISAYPEDSNLRLVVAANAMQCSEESLAAIVNELAGALEDRKQ